MRALAYFLATLLGATLGFAGGVPFPPNQPYPDTAAILSGLNAWIQTLNGVSNPFQPTPVIVSAGGFCTASGATPQTCNAQRGTVTFTGVTVAAVSTGNVVMTQPVRRISERVTGLRRMVMTVAVRARFVYRCRYGSEAARRR